MKIALLSDLHGQLINSPKIEKVDMIIYAGDLTNMGSPYEIENFAIWFLTLPSFYKILVGGNHDFDLQGSKTYWKNNFRPLIKYLDEEDITIEGLKIYGTPYSRIYGGWAFMEEESVLQRKYENIPEDIDILITHGPPYQLLDKTIGGKNAGSKALRQVIDSGKFHKLKLIVCGHIHEAYGQMNYKGIQIVNCSILDENYKIKNSPIYLEINP